MAEVIEFDLSKLLGRIVERFGTRERFAEALGISPGIIYARLRGESFFQLDEIYRIIAPECLDIPAGEISDYFFTLKVR